MSDAEKIIVESEDADWVEIDCNTYEDYIKKIGYFSGASEEDRLTVYSTYIDPEGHNRSLIEWGNKAVGLVLRWTGYLGRRREIECKRWIGRHALVYYADKAEQEQETG